MKASRWLAGLVVLAAVVLLALSWEGRDSTREVSVPRAGVPVVLEGTAGSWFCAAREAGVEGLEHTVFVSPTGSDPVSVEMSTFGEEGGGPSSSSEVAAGGTAVLEVGEAGGAPVSAMVEVSGPAVVEHRLAHPGGADQAPCTSTSSEVWYFPAVSTTRDATARLTLFNPFTSDAAVDVEVAFDTGVRVPRDLAGIVVPAGTSRVVELGESVQRRDQFSATVTTRSGRVVAELAQSFDDADEALPVSGLRLEPGSAVADGRWSVAAGFTDPTAREQLVLLNPGDEEVEVLVQVIPYSGLDVLPEPFSLEVPSRRYGIIDLQAESRVPQVGAHAVEVEVVGDGEVVVSRVLDVTGPPASESTEPVIRARITRGTSASGGSVAAAARWLATGLDAPADVAVAVHNPGTGIALAEVRGLGEDGRSVSLEIPPGDSRLVPGEDLGAAGAPWAAEVVSEGQPVVVDRLIVFPEQSDFSLQPAVAVVADASELEDLG